MPYEFELDVVGEMPNYFEWIMSVFSPYTKGHVVEYGAGIGTVSRAVQPLASQLTLVEPTADFIPILHQKFDSDRKVEVVAASLEQHAPSLNNNTIDTIIMVNVLEHIADDRDALFHLLRALRVGGHLLIFVPALRFLMSKLDVKFGHFRRYQRADLVEKVVKVGGQIEVCRYFDFFGIASWFFINTLMGATSFNPRLLSVHNKLVVPVSRTIERVITPPIGKNIILVAKKK
jgi:SAM-dependent methyltransferase